MIEVLIAEVSAEEGLEMGVEMSALSLPGPGSTTISGGSRLDAATDSLMTKIQQGIFPRGLTVGVGQGTVAGTVAATTAGAAAGTTAGAAAATTVAAVPAVLNLDAIRKSGKFKIVSETALEGQNNLEASVKIVNDIPILKSTIQGGAGTARDVVQNIERMDVGIKLKLTPHVIEGGEVRMTLSPSIEAVVDAGSAETQFTPTIARREVNTTVTVPDGQVIVIAGLTREDRRQTLKQVPLLGSIPLVGLLFRQRVDATQKTNMLIFVTPHIVTRMSAAEKAMKNWRAKTGITEGAAEGGGPKKRRFWRR
jgi:general secretion pathway protein D